MNTFYIYSVTDYFIWDYSSSDKNDKHFHN